MAITFEAVISGTTYELNDKNPFTFEGVTGMGPAPVNRFGQRSPLQHGITDLGFRLGPRELEFSFLFYAATATTLDTNRQSFMNIFEPLDSLPIKLKVTRDDGTIRTLNCFTTGQVEIELVPQNYPGHLHRAKTTLRTSGSPSWSAATATTASFAGTTTTWWTANGVIGTANVMEHVEFPTQGQAWTYTGTITGDWTVAFRSGQETGSGTKTAFRVGTAANDTDPKIWWYGGTSWAFTQVNNVKPLLVDGTQNYMAVKILDTGFHFETLYYAGDTIWISESGTDQDISGTARTWRSAPGSAAATRWTNEFPKAAIYNKALDSTERLALNSWMEGTAIIGTITAVNSGDLPAYPYITIAGPIINPILTNVTTGKIINLNGLAMGSAEVVTIDLTTGNKVVLDAGNVNKTSYMGTPAQLANWALVPSPTASGGTNSIRVQGGSTSTDTTIMIAHTNQYMSF